MADYIDTNYVNNNYRDIIEKKREEIKEIYDNLMQYASDRTPSSFCKFLGISKEEYKKYKGDY